MGNAPSHPHFICLFPPPLLLCLDTASANASYVPSSLRLLCYSCTQPRQRIVMFHIVQISLFWLTLADCNLTIPPNVNNVELLQSRSLASRDLSGRVGWQQSKCRSHIPHASPRRPRQIALA